MRQWSTVTLPKCIFIFILRWGTVWSQLRNSRNKTKQKKSRHQLKRTEHWWVLMKCANAAFFFCLIEQTGLELKLGNFINVFKISQTNVLHCTPATWQLAACVVQKRTTQINPEQHLTRSWWLSPNLSSHLGLFVSGVKHLKLKLSELGQSHVREWKNSEGKSHNSENKFWNDRYKFVKTGFWDHF